MGKIQISPDQRLDLIAEIAGQPDPNMRIYREGFLHVDGVTDDDLFNASQSQLLDDQKKKYDLSKQIKNLEAQQTPRRVREAALGLDDGWLKNLDDQIKTLRTQLKGA